MTATQTSANITADEVNTLPMGRTPYLIAEMMPGLTTNTPNPNQLTISGGFAYDNVFLLDGVDVNDNLIGSMNDLYIEEGTFCLLDDWDLFLAMILAKARGIPHPRECCGAEDQARGGALRREQEARRHQRPLSEISPASLDEKINDSAA